MGDVRYQGFYDQVVEADDPRAAIRALDDEGVIAALAAASRGGDAYLANVLATEAMNRVRRSTIISHHLGEGVYVLNPEGCIIFLNPAAERMLGWTQEELEGRDFHEMVHHTREDGSALERGECAGIIALKTGRVVHQRGQGDAFTRRDGSRFPVEITAAPMEQENEIVGAVAVFRDMTEERRAQAALEESEARKSAMLHASLDAIITIDADSRILEWNHAAEEIFGYEASEVLGRDMTDIIIPERFRESHRRGMNHYLETGEGPVLSQRLDLPALRRDGSEFPSELAIIPIEAGGRRLFTGYLRDVSEQTRAEEARRESEARYREILERVTDSFIALGRDWRIIYLNPQALHIITARLGLPDDNLQGNVFWDAIPGIRGTVFERHYQHAMATQEPVHFEAPFGPFDAWFEVHAYPGEDGLSIFFRDVTERHRAEARLQESEQRYRSLFASSPLPILVADTKRGIIDMNPAFTETFGFTLDDLRGSTTRPLYPSQEAYEAVGRGIQEHFGSGPFVERIRWRTQEGRFLPADMHVSYLRDDEGNVTGFIGTLEVLDEPAESP